MITYISFTISPLEDFELQPVPKEIDFPASNENFLKAVLNLVSTWYKEATVTGQVDSVVSTAVYAQSDADDLRREFKEIDQAEIDVKNAVNLIYDEGKFWELNESLDTATVDVLV